MQSTTSDAQSTQFGQAIAINKITCEKLSLLFAPMFGPHGTSKALVSGGMQLTITKDGISICRDVQFTTPTSVVITRAATSLYSSSGDGTIGFVLLCTEIFNQAYKYYIDGTSIPLIINSLQLALRDATVYAQNSIIPLSDKSLKDLALCSLKTKIKNPEFLVDIILQALVSITSAGKFDIDMVEVIKMEGGDIRDSLFINGLVLDHSGRHHEMPTKLENVCVLITNMSLEYEKPEINAEFYYKSAAERDLFVENEREFILNKCKEIADFATSLKKEGRSLILVNEKGIDPRSLEILSNAGILALRRAKRRNLERLVNMCGGKIITQTNQLIKENLGFCQSVSVKDFGENKYTFIEGTPFKGSCTILVRGNNEYERLKKSITGTLQSLMIGIQSKCCINGGIYLYKGIIEYLNSKLNSVHECDIFGYKIIANAFEFLIKTLLRNEGKNVHENLAKIFREELKPEVVENVKVFGNMLNSSVITAINLLMCDEIIKAGKAIKQDKIENQN